VNYQIIILKTNCSKSVSHTKTLRRSCLNKQEDIEQTVKRY